MAEDIRNFLHTTPIPTEAHHRLPQETRPDSANALALGTDRVQATPDSTLDSPAQPAAQNPPLSQASTSGTTSGTGKRTVFSRDQLKRLEDRFRVQSFLSRDERLELAGELGLTDRQIMVWFQNRRGRLKKRGPADRAYNSSKLKELNRPYPVLYGVLSHSNNMQQQSDYGHLLAMYPDEVRRTAMTVTNEGKRVYHQTTYHQKHVSSSSIPDLHKGPPNVVIGPNHQVQSTCQKDSRDRCAIEALSLPSLGPNYASVSIVPEYWAESTPKVKVASSGWFPSAQNANSMDYFRHGENMAGSQNIGSLSSCNQDGNGMEFTSAPSVSAKTMPSNQSHDHPYPCMDHKESQFLSQSHSWQQTFPSNAPWTQGSDHRSFNTVNQSYCNPQGSQSGAGYQINGSQHLNQGYYQNGNSMYEDTGYFAGDGLTNYQFHNQH